MKQTPPSLAFLEAEIAAAQARDLWRTRPAPVHGARSFGSNDYLGLADDPAPPIASGAGAARLVTGEHAAHGALEDAVAALVGQETALVFTSGYAANVGVLSALAGPTDLIVSDALNHASIIDGCRLSRARVAVVPHLDVGAVSVALEAPRGGRAFVVTESYFSMDADQPDLGALRAVCDRHNAVLVVDEAHALGVLGPEGRGLGVGAGVLPDVTVGTFGKAFGAGGAFAAGCRVLTSWLWNRARSFVFSTGLSPAVAAAAERGMRRAAAEPGRRARALRNADRLRAGLAAMGLEVRGVGPIVPWILGSPAAALRMAEQLRSKGLDVRAIRPPTVPDGTARIRLTVTAAHDDADVDRAIAAIASATGRAHP